MLLALTRPTGPELQECQLTHLARSPIDVNRALDQHEAYLQVLQAHGVQVVELERLARHPDAVFVEDTALVLDELAVLLRPGAPSRQGEVASVAQALAPYRPCVAVDAPATVDGGDLVVLDRTILVGVTSRTSPAGAEALARLVAPACYHVRTVAVTGCLHLKSALTAIDPQTVVAHRPFVTLDGLDVRVIDTDPAEPHGANVVSLGPTLLVNAAAPRTAERLAAAGYEVVPVDVSEFAKAEGALTCKSVLLTIAS
jgi:dimethylargininase